MGTHVVRRRNFAVRGSAGAVLLIVCSLLIGGIGRAAVQRGWFDAIDPWSFATESASWIAFWRLWGAVATTKGAAVGGALLVALLFGRRQYKNGVILLGSAASAALAQSLLKSWVGRPRPNDSLMLETGSFPSGQAFVSLALYGLFAALLTQSLKSDRSKRVVTAAASLLIALICLGRVALGEHYVSDVAAGLLLGIVWVWVGVWTSKTSAA